MTRATTTGPTCGSVRGGDAGRPTAARRPEGPRPAQRDGDATAARSRPIGLPATVRAGERATIRYAWRALRPMTDDYTAFVHVAGDQHTLNQDHLLGSGRYGTSSWAPGERAWATLPLVVPPDTPPGRYEVRIGVWLPEPRAHLNVAKTDLPTAGQAVVVGVLEVRP